MVDLARYTAFSVLQQLSKGRHTLDGLLDNAISAAKIRSRRDRSFIFALTHGTLRWRGRLDWILDQIATRPVRKMNPKVRQILRLGLFQILFLDRVPDSAAVNTSVALSKTVAGPKVAGFVNAVLRNASRRRETITLPDPEHDPVAAIAVRGSFPRWMIERWITQMGYKETCALCRATNAIAPLTVRTNTLKTDRSPLMEQFCRTGMDPAPTHYSPVGIVLDRIPSSVPELPGFADGHFQVQDEAAQWVTFLLDPRPGENVLDACAGLGGKTGHIAQQMENSGRITAAELYPEKLARLDEEMTRLGMTIVSSRVADLTDPSDLTSLGRFDRILLDAPCSGLGVLRRHPDAKWRHAPGTFATMAKRQLRMLARLSALVKPGGTIVYAVCSTEPEENEGVIRRFLDHHPEFSVVPAGSCLPENARQLVNPAGFFRSLVHRHQMDGFFIARLRKSDTAQS